MTAHTDLSDTWVWVRLGDIVQYQGGYAYKSDTYVKQSNNQVVRLGNVKNSALLLSASPVYIPNHIAEETDEYRIVKDTILFTMTGTKGKRDYFYTCKTTEDNSFRLQTIPKSACWLLAPLFWNQFGLAHHCFAI